MTQRSPVSGGKKPEGQKSVFDSFTHKYALSKTLRFELVPVGKTIESMRTHLKYDEELQTFLKDQAIEDAYQLLKPIVDGYHEEFITDSLQSDIAKNINFALYVNLRLKLAEYNIALKQAKVAKTHTADLEKNLDQVEKNISDAENNFRADISTAFLWAGENWKNNKYPKPRYEWKKGTKIATGATVLASQCILDLVGDAHQDNEKVRVALKVFKGFFTYFSGFNQNRENYYTTKTEKATAVATRIVHENLPMFCDNVIIFESKKAEYVGTFEFLKSREKVLEMKDGIPLIPISGDIFKDTHFGACLSQKEIEEYNKLIGNANFLINLYNQERSKEDKFKRLTIFNTLYKQIGCGKKKPLFFALTHDNKSEADEMRAKDKEAFSVEEVLLLAKHAGEKYFRGRSEDDQLTTVADLIAYLKGKENFEGVYWSKAGLNSISNRYFAEWETLAKCLKDAKVFKKAPKGDEEEIKISEAIELQGFFEVIDATENWKQEGVFFRESITKEIEGGKSNKKNQQRRDIIAYSHKPSEALLGLIFLDIEEHAKDFLSNADEITSLASYKSEEEKVLIKGWMDTALSVTQILKYFQIRESKAKGAPMDTLLYGALKSLLRAEDAEWFKWYDALRNYLTKKPQDDAKENKLKLNFDAPSLLAGWDRDLENQRKSVILRSSQNYYLVVMDKNSGTLFTEDTLPQYSTGEECFEKMYFKQATSVFRQLPKIGFPYKKDKSKPMFDGDVNNFDTKPYEERCRKFGLDREIMEIKDAFDLYQGSKKKGDKFSVEKLKKLISYYKKIIEINYRDVFSVETILNKEYAELNDLYNDFESVAYELVFKPVSRKYIDGLVEEGKVYMFKIMSKDFSEKSTGNKNLHSIYFSSLFDDPKRTNQLGANAQIFYRKYAIKEKKVKAGYENKPWIIENKRFTENSLLTKEGNERGEEGKSFFFHCPLSINAASGIEGISDGKPNPKAIGLINDRVKETFSVDANACFLGIDRGEKHLAYYSLVDKNGKLLEQKTLNMPFVDKDGKPRAVKVMRKMKDGSEVEVECWDYNDLLEARAGDRDYARKNWQTIGTIANLKEGYVSQVVRTVADLAIQDNKPTYIVLEDLNTGFKRLRQKIEKSVYQKFEVALAKKLNFLVDKSAQIGEIGSVTRAIQLTPPVNNYGDIEKKKQAGIMLYTRPNYTSQTDPVTGWRKCIYLKKGSEESIKNQITGNTKKKDERNSPNFTEIAFDGKDYFFVYNDQSTGKEWKMYSGENGKSLARFHKERNSMRQWVAESQDIASVLNELFANFNKTKSLLEQMKSGVELSKPKNSKYTAWESLRFAIDLIQQIRNTGTTKRDDDFLVSPVRDENGVHFDTRVYWDKEQSGEKAEMPTCGDAVGAFNIARKGIIMNEHIKRELSLYVADTEWDAWLAGKEVWEKWLRENMKSLVFKKKQS